MSKRQEPKQLSPPDDTFPLGFFACPNPDCAAFNTFEDTNLSVCVRMGKNKDIRRLYCKVCHTRFSERQGSLMQERKLPQPAVVRIVKCLGHGCSMEATADICEVDPRTVQRLLEHAGKRAEDFHNVQLEKLPQSIPAAQMDVRHGHLSDGQEIKGAPGRLRSVLRRVTKRDAPGFMRLWP